jgi:CRP-like cAMP-binding protein
MDTALAKKIGFLSGLSDDDLAALLASARRVEFRKGEVLLAQGVSNDRLRIVAEGRLHARRRTEGEEALLGRIEPGDFFGEMSLFDPAPTSAEVAAVTGGVLLEIYRESLEKFLTDRPQATRPLLMGFLRDLSRRLRDAGSKIADALHWSRIAK